VRVDALSISDLTIATLSSKTPWQTRVRCGNKRLYRVLSG
jgi:hypothetical protein